MKFAIASILTLLSLTSMAFADVAFTQNETTSLDTPCGQEPDEWTIRQPTQSEIDSHGLGILVFEYFNSPARCSDDTSGIGVWYENASVGIMTITVHGEANDFMEEISFTPHPTFPYTRHSTEPLMVPDSSTPYQIILYPIIS